MTYMPETEQFQETDGASGPSSGAGPAASPFVRLIEAHRRASGTPPAGKTHRIFYCANLPEAATPAAILSQRHGDGGQGDGASPPEAIFGCDETQFLPATLPGGSLMIRNAAGIAARLTLRWAKIGVPGRGQTHAWALYHLIKRKAGYAEAAWLNSGPLYRFDASGRLEPALDAFTLRGLVIDGRAFGDLPVHHPNAGITQFPDRWGCVRVNTLMQA